MDVEMKELTWRQGARVPVWYSNGSRTRTSGSSHICTRCVQTSDTVEAWGIEWLKEHTLTRETGSRAGTF